MKKARCRFVWEWRERLHGVATLCVFSRLLDSGEVSCDGVRHTDDLPETGNEIVDLEDASCCPDPIYFKSRDKLNRLAVAARNLCLAEEMGLNIFTSCSGCTADLPSNTLNQDLRT